MRIEGFKSDKNGKIASIFSSELEIVIGMTDSTSFFVYIYLNLQKEDSGATSLGDWV
jgi:hypothetical protein